MGYESKLYIVEKSNIHYKGDCGKNWCSVIAMIDMCKMDSDFQKLFTKETDCYFFADDGNTEIATDMYDEPLRECSLEAVETYVQNQIAQGAIYRRLWPLLSLVRAFDSPQWNKKSLAVLHYGY